MRNRLSAGLHYRKAHRGPSVGDWENELMYVASSSRFYNTPHAAPLVPLVTLVRLVLLVITVLLPLLLLLLLLRRTSHIHNLNFPVSY